MDAAGFLERRRRRPPPTALLGRLIDEVTIKETFFFRQRRELDAIDWRRLHRGAPARPGPRRCGSGSPPAPRARRPTRWRCSPARRSVRSRRRCRSSPPTSPRAPSSGPGAGRYGRRALRALDPGCASATSSRWRAAWPWASRCASLVEFRRHNLVLDPAPTVGGRPFDLIACRNVLIYFDAETVERVIASLEGALAPHGDADARRGGPAVRLGAPPGAPGRVGGGPRPAQRPGARPLRRPLGRARQSAAVPAPPHRRPASRRPCAPRTTATSTRPLAVTERLLRREPARRRRALRPRAGRARRRRRRGRRGARSGAPSTSIPPSGWPPSSSAALTRRSATAPPPRAPTSRRCARSTRSDERHALILDQVDLGDVAAACAIRARGAAGARAR